MDRKRITIVIIIILAVVAIVGVLIFGLFLNKKQIVDEIYEEKIFNDVPISHWASEYIRFVAQRGIMTASGDDNFYPDKTVTEGEFSKILALASLNNSNFQDFSGDNNLDYAEVLEKYGVLKKDEIDEKKEITRSKVAILLAKTDLNIKLSNQVIGALNYDDLTGIDEVGQTLISHSIEKNFITSDEEKKFNPNKTVTRAEIANYIFSFLNN